MSIFRASCVRNRETDPTFYERNFNFHNQLRPYTAQDVERIREVANTIERYGWVQETYGDCERGFCLQGAVEHVLDTQAYMRHANKENYSFLGNNDTRWSDEIQIRRAMFDYGPLEIGNAPIHFNDVTAKDADEVISALRITADKLEAHLEGMGNE